MEIRKIGRFVNIKFLAKGAYGWVYSAYDPDINRKVALKTIHLPDDVTNEELKRFRREVQTAAHLNHPHIVQIYDVNLASDVPYLVMELLSGGNMKDKLNGKILTWDEALNLLLPLCDALAYAHGKGIIHRDVKPKNVMFTEDGKLKLVDFGLARRLGTETLTRSDNFIGTLTYASPEQINTKNNLVGPHSDVFSYGIILYECIVGKNPWPGIVLDLLFEAVSSDSFDFSPLEKRAPKQLVKILKKALEKDVDRRYPNCIELYKDLSSLLLEDAHPLPPSPFIKRVSLGLKSHKKIWISLALSLAFLCIMLTWILRPPFPGIFFNPSPTFTPSITSTFTPSITSTFTPSNTPTFTPSRTPTSTLSSTPTSTPSSTPPPLRVIPSLTATERKKQSDEPPDKPTKPPSEKPTDEPTDVPPEPPTEEPTDIPPGSAP